MTSFEVTGPPGENSSRPLGHRGARRRKGGRSLRPGTGGPSANGPSTGGPSTPIDDEFRALFTAEFEATLRLAHLLGAADPENIAQEAFVRLHEHWGELADTSRAGGYLRTTVVNLCRSAGRRATVATLYEQSRPDPEPEPSAEMAALASVSDQALLVSLGALTPRHREALVLRFWLDLPAKEMAEIMDCSVGSVKAHVSRGLSALRSHLNDTGDLR